MAKRIGFIGYHNITALDLAGPLEVFAAANTFTSTKIYELVVVSASGKAFQSEAGLRIAADCSFKDASNFDTVIVPGGAGLRDSRIAGPVVAFLKSRVQHTRRIVSVCTGLEALAQAGLVDGRQTTTHWRFASAIADKFPRLRMNANAIYLKDGKYYTSAGITAGIDLSLALVTEDLGEKIALQVARDLIVYLKRPGGQEQFSEPLQFQVRADDGFSDLSAWVLRNLDKDLSVDVLSTRVNLGTRHFTRRFKAVFGLTPAAYVQKLRLDEARRRLPMSRHSIERIAASVGYSSPDVFRRAFERHFGVSPGTYGKQFG